MRWGVCIAVLCWFNGVTAQLDSVAWDAAVWGQHRSNALDHELGRLLVRGGSIDRSLIEAARSAQGNEMGAFGFASGFAVNWNSVQKWRETDAHLCGSFGLKTLGDVRWTPELFDLVFTGNAGHLGRWDVLDGSRVRTSTWAHAAVGWVGANQSRIELGLVHRLNAIDARIQNGHFYVNETVDSLAGFVRGYVGWAERSEWGMLVNAEWHFLREDAPFAFHLRVQNVGFVLGPEWTELSVDTLIETTGLALTGPGLSVEALSESTGAEEILTVTSEAYRVRWMPARIDASFEYPLGPRSGWDLQAQVGDWMPVPRAMTGYRRAIGKQWQAGVQLVAGGWGRLRPAAWARWRKPGEHALMVYIEDPFGWGSKSAYGRGITLRYQNL